MTVFSLWATVITVLFLKDSFIALQITDSVFTSILAVASSTSTILVGLMIALAILISCLSPTLRFSPFQVIYVMSPFLSSIVYLRAVISKASFNLSSEMFDLSLSNSLLVREVVIGVVIDDPHCSSSSFNRSSLIIDT